MRRVGMDDYLTKPINTPYRRLTERSNGLSANDTVSVMLPDRIS
jgi:hypothetical protein